MTNQTLLEQMKAWGYYLLPKTHREALGYRELHIAIRPQPTKLHFDPTSIHWRLAQDGYAKWTTVGLGALPDQAHHVCPGCIILRDRKDKETEFFTFGGTVEVIYTPEETIYSLYSSAPILEITKDVTSSHDQLAFELGAILARFAAQWGMHPEKFEQRLTQIDAQQLYLASLEAILSQYEDNTALRMQYHNLYYDLLHEKEWLQENNQYPPTTPTLTALLAP